MFLEKLEIQGFKSFAHKTTIIFPTRNKKTQQAGITSIVGPNGSGKSNIADSVRWVLGEQSIKLLRGKKSPDVIFSGSSKLSRLGFAEAALFLNNEDKKAPIDYSQVVIKRRVYRDGSSEYKINDSNVRLSDIQLLLAQSNFGHRTYSVIGQGMVDSILASSPNERKEFFDEATGVKQYQIKREQTQRKLATTEENLTQISGLVNEIAPRLKSLERQIKRLEKRSGIEAKLRNLQLKHYSRLWHANAKDVKRYADQKQKLNDEYGKLGQQMDKLNNELEELAKKQQKEPASDFASWQKKYQENLDAKSRLQAKLAVLEHQLKDWQNTKTAASKNINQQNLLEGINKCLSFLKKVSQTDSLEQLKNLRRESGILQAQINKILRGGNDSGPDGKIAELQQQIKSITVAANDLNKNIIKSQDEQAKLRQVESKTTASVFAIQKQYQSLQQNFNQMSANKNQIEIKLASIMAHKEDLEQEMRRELPADLLTRVQRAPADESQEDLWPQIARAKYELEMIGGIEPGTAEEYEQTKSRYDHLVAQSNDLHNALAKTKQALKNLDDIIDKEFNKGFVKIEKEFAKNFSVLFSGGKAGLEIKKENELDSISEEMASELTAEEQEKLANTFKIGIEIKASPPGKRVSGINMLSGGERALTSIALITAIIQANPSPFVILDEVDAALDEANSERFAEILDAMSKHTQFITITHNRATMEKSNILYGVTMGDDGVSKLLSVDLEKAVASIKK